jgi:NAD(P)H-nitrite reductase large subunit
MFPSIEDDGVEIRNYGRFVLRRYVEHTAKAVSAIRNRWDREECTHVLKDNNVVRLTQRKRSVIVNT